MNAYFVTGTDTEVGKTTFSVHWLRWLRARGRKVAVLKPVASGAQWCPKRKRLVNDDALALQQAAGDWQPLEEVNPFVFEPPIAPHIAAKQQNQPLSIAEIEAKTRHAFAYDVDTLVIEGAGGFLLPLNERETLADWVQQKQLPTILVVGLRLGCLNHALLTIESIQNRGLQLVGWVANILNVDMPMLAENLATLRTMLPAPQL
ncbi:MAG: dethiobiotin synthase, partial [Gammaproteobacteria bacterium]